MAVCSTKSPKEDMLGLGSMVSTLEFTEVLLGPKNAYMLLSSMDYFTLHSVF